MVRARVKVLAPPPHPTPWYILFQDGLGTVGLKGDRVCKELSVGTVSLSLFPLFVT